MPASPARRRVCPREDHVVETYEEYEALVDNIRPWPDMDMVIGECRRPGCGSTISWAVHPRREEVMNPSVAAYERDPIVVLTKLLLAINEQPEEYDQIWVSVLWRPGIGDDFEIADHEDLFAAREVVETCTDGYGAVIYVPGNGRRFDAERTATEAMAFLLKEQRRLNYRHDMTVNPSEARYCRCGHGREHHEIDDQTTGRCLARGPVEDAGRERGKLCRCLEFEPVAVSSDKRPCICGHDHEMHVRIIGGYGPAPCGCREHGCSCSKYKSAAPLPSARVIQRKNPPSPRAGRPGVAVGTYAACGCKSSSCGLHAAGRCPNQTSSGVCAACTAAIGANTLDCSCGDPRCGRHPNGKCRFKSRPGDVFCHGCVAAIQAAAEDEDEYEDTPDCYRCGGTGEIGGEDCDHCDGEGLDIDPVKEPKGGWYYRSSGQVVVRLRPKAGALDNFEGWVYSPDEEVGYEFEIRSPNWLNAPIPDAVDRAAGKAIDAAERNHDDDGTFAGFAQSDDHGGYDIWRIDEGEAIEIGKGKFDL